LFSVSGTAAEVEQAYDLGASAYLIKPSSLKDLTELLQITCAFWGRCASPQRVARSYQVTEA
jgi:DNA-binding NarL/FixJ family response regulator